ncbi:hypothetical protein [Comamonas kerstersii]|uniref:hypothetical protein n=1 Tax=Comamonas kerstersii TaxID=225992 RepID=UPI001B322927|nr:hypothetical protein [Comamonas kerstersii]QTW20213.1 hypothetical protein H8N02_07300 [Comamonas kerstersii]
MTCYDAMLLDRYQSEVDAAEAHEAAIEAAQDHALSILERETKAITPVQWFSKKLSSSWTMHEVFTDALDADSDIASAFAVLVTKDDPDAERLRQLLRERHAHTQYHLIVPSYDPF